MNDARELKEQISEMGGHEEDMDQEIEKLKAEIDRMIKGLNEISPEEKEIMGKIRGVLEEHELKYSYDEDEPKHIGLGFGMENKPFKIHIILQNGKVIFRLSFLFRVQTNAFPLMCLYMAEFNDNKDFLLLNLDSDFLLLNPDSDFLLLNLDSDNGELTMEYFYMLEDLSHFNEKYFWIYMTSLIHAALKVYTKASRLAVGMVSGKERRRYKKLLEMALETVNGDFDDSNVSYGTEELSTDDHMDLSELFSFGDEDEDDSKSDKLEVDEKSLTDAGQRSRRRMIPDFEEFLRMRGHTEAESEEETSRESSKKTGEVLSMFAKKKDADGKDRRTAGGDKDE